MDDDIFMLDDDEKPKKTVKNVKKGPLQVRCVKMKFSKPIFIKIIYESL